ncbi:MAG: serine hydrolase [Armatimonadetes bacterium]|nr:serine hydrolase [Armatimonadota bacterium]MDE2206828.1 serine hydrolase [Armatimonadota bacterium]
MMTDGRDDAWLDAAIEREEARCGGEISLEARSLTGTFAASRHAARQVTSASVVKLPILLAAALLVERGSVGWTDQLELRDDGKVPGSGVLTQLTPGLTLSLRDACCLMTTVSDNTATNLVIDHVGLDRINQEIERFGLAGTRVFRKVFHDDDPAKPNPFGFGVVTARDMALLLSQLHTGQGMSPGSRTEMLKMLEQQYYRDGIPRLLPDGWSYAGKTGAVDDVRNDVGLVTSPAGGCMALAIFVQKLPKVLWTADNPGLLAIANLAREICGRCSEAGADG